MRPGFLASPRLDSELQLECVDDPAKVFEIYATILTSLKLAHCRLEF
jgi:hypothetical protein